MEQQKSITKNMVMSIILTTSNFLFPLITYAHVARVLLPAGTGKVAFVQSVLSYFSYIAALGIQNYGTRECAKIRDDKEKLSLFVQELLRINIVSTIVSYVILFVSLILVSKFRENVHLFVIMSASILLQTLGMEWLYSALEKYTYITIRSIIFKIISLILTFLMIREQEDYLWYGLITIFATSASNILNFINCHKYITFGKSNTYALKRHLKPIMVFFFTTVVITIYGNFDSIMLGFMKGDSEVGIYTTALKMKGIVLSFSTALTSVLIPRMSVYIEKKEQHKFNMLLCKSVKVTLVLLLPLSIFVFINAKNIIEFICGNEYISADITLKILMVCTVILSLTNLFGNQILIPKGDEKRYSISVFIGMFINLGINILLIPRFGASGAATATLITECFILFWMGRGCLDEIALIKKNIQKRTYLLSVLLASFTECIVMRITIQFSLFLRIVINAMSLFGIYYLLLILQREEILCGFWIKIKLIVDVIRKKYRTYK